MEMKDAPLVQEEIASSKVKNLRKVAVTVAVVALTVCGVAVGMVAAGMESKTVPTLKYTPGTKTTYNHSMKTSQGSTKGNFEQAMEVEQFVLARDAVTGATTFLVSVPVQASNVDGATIAPESTPEEAEVALPNVAFVVTQAADGTIDYANVKCQIDRENPAFGAASNSLVHHLRMTSPRLAAEATVSELDSFTGLQTDAKYSVNNLEQGTTEVVRTVSPASVQNQVGGPQLANSAASSVTVKDGEVVAAKASQAAEMSAMYEAKGPASTGEVNHYIDSRESFATDASMTKGATESFDLASFAADLASFNEVDLSSDVETESQAKAPYVVNSKMDQAATINVPRAEETAEEERALLNVVGSWSKTFWSGKAYEVKLTAAITITASNACVAKKCSNNAAIAFTVTAMVELAGKPLTGTLAVTKSAKQPGSSVSVEVKLVLNVKISLKITNSWTVTITFYNKTLSTNVPDDDDSASTRTPTVPLFKHPLITLNCTVKFTCGSTISPGIAGFKTLGAGKWKCVKKCGSSGSYRCSARRNQNRGGRQATYSQQFGSLPSRNSQWKDKDTPMLFGVIRVSRSNRYYIKHNGNFYTTSSCSIRYTNNKSKFRLKATHNLYYAVTLDVYLQTGCILYNRIRIGIEITGKFLSLSQHATAYISVGSGDCWHADYAQDGASVEIKPYIQRRYGYRWRKSNCHKKQYIFLTLTEGIKFTFKFEQSVTAHLALWSYPHLLHAKDTSAPNDATTSGFTKPIYYTSGCKNSKYTLEPMYGPAKKYNTYA